MNGARTITGRHVLIGLLSFFGIIFAANGLLVYFALETWPGLSTQKAYEEGLAYNRTLDAARKQQTLGWSSTVNIAGEPATVRARLIGPSGPVTGLNIRIILRRPVVEGLDVAAALSEKSSGVYSAPVRLPNPGRWTAVLVARRGEDVVYRMSHELMVKP